ncbi:hypothetical protein F4V91_26680 [Neorhizobium galegae]|uniref:Uncharacterized protein n=1 Tax=Neorhizobium galegae TaxID=399 RepID=A0A6A1TKR2_NEOGA|nr:hypothetical protein F4V91_26680 [Neorhizobium galegae]
MPRVGLSRTESDPCNTSIRCSVGLEDAEDLIEDILEALDFG